MRCKESENIQPISWVLASTRQILLSIKHHTLPVYNTLVYKIDGLDESSLYLTQIAIGLEPELMGIAHVFSRMPYSNPTYIRKDLKNAVASEWLTYVREGVYRASEKGHNVFQYICQDVERVYRNLNPMPVSQLEQMDKILHKVVVDIRDETCLRYKPSFDIDLKLGKADGPVFQRICCNLSHLMSYRDDAYVNAWMDQDVNSYVWEAFSCIYKGQAQTASEISEKLGKYRHYDVHTYESSLRELVDRDWITLVDGIYEPTHDGIKVLAKVAREMNKKFFKPWTVLKEDELKALRGLMESLANSLHVRKPKYGAGYANINRTIGWGSVQWVRDKVR